EQVGRSHVPALTPECVTDAQPKPADNRSEVQHQVSVELGRTPGGVAERSGSDADDGRSARLNLNESELTVEADSGADSQHRDAERIDGGIGFLLHSHATVTT